MDDRVEIYGVDISKAFFDVVDQNYRHFKFGNNKNGFQDFAENLNENSLVVMEATGCYHYCLAQFLYENNFKVSVVNPLSIKRFIQMKLSKVKTDKSDAKAIYEYAQINRVPIYTGRSSIQAKCLQLLSLQDFYVKQRTAIKNKIQGEKSLGSPSEEVEISLKRTLNILNIEIKLLQDQLEILVNEIHNKQLSQLMSIPGIGIKTAMLLIVLTDGFTSFENSRQLCSYAGITPTIRQSGSSIKGRSRISKLGNPKLRNLLFLCSFSACKHNKPCKELYLRIVAKGKSKKLALIAVCNKLLKQAFAIARSNENYQEDYSGKILI
ncbi:transposase [Gillisia mitskevichiae]|uniref:Transposase n=1 Tax=Gillisia mitskevichiae TaxID=270921 RepID=A0A495P097_9FLAO|nr:IS110 family transposase [Gillisia mitskevichiae]RKS42822.1 transposase [Gillisia mitskevichiae]